MRLRIKLAHKLGGAFAVLLCCALALGGMAHYSLHSLSNTLRERSAFEAVLELGQKAQFAAYDWLVHREELAMAASTNKSHSPLVQYQQLRADFFSAIDSFSSQPNSSIESKTLNQYKAAFEKFDASFGAYQHNFEMSVTMVKGLRKASVGLLAKAQSLDKAIDRRTRKLNKQIQSIKDAVQSHSFDPFADDKKFSLQLLKRMEQMKTLTKQKQIAAIMLNKPLSFQEMAKDFILYKDEASGKGLILEMEKLLGLNDNASMGETLSQLSAAFPAGRESKLFDQITALTKQYLEAFQNYFTLTGKMKISMREMTESQVELRTIVTTIRQEATARFIALQDAATKRMGALSLVAVLVSILFVVMSVSQVVLPIRRIIGDIGNACAAIAFGSNKTLHRIRRKGGDELGDLARCFNELLDVFEDNTKEIATATNRAETEAQNAKAALDSLQKAQEKAESARREGMLEAVHALERIVSNLVQTSNIIATQISDASTQAGELQRRTSESSLSLREMGTSIQAVASSSSLAALNADEVMGTAHKGADVVQGAIEAIFKVRSQTDLLKSSLTTLSTQASSINEIMTVINDIADQTNLLALNAAIEAARAGDAGRGFAVVADEVRKLAEKTMNATKDVEQAIYAIQNSADENVIGMERAEEAVSGSTKLAEEAGSSLQEIVDLIEESASQVRNIATAVEQQSTSSEQITVATSVVNSVAGEMATLMEKSDDATSDLMQLASELRDLINELRQECGQDTNEYVPLAHKTEEHAELTA